MGEAIGKLFGDRHAEGIGDHRHMARRYAQVGEFFEQLESLPLFISITQFELRPDELKPGVLKADITLAAYEEPA